MIRLLFIAAIISALSTQAAFATFDPSNPGGSGYQIVYDSEFNDISEIDVNTSRGPGFKWYLSRWFSYGNTPSSAVAVSGGILTITAPVSGGNNWQISTAAPSSTSPYYVGKAFKGAFYVEARVAFDDTTIDTATGWPSFWSESLRHLIASGATGIGISGQGVSLATSLWPGQAANYEHFIEDDFMEKNVAGQQYVNSSMHDWFGIPNVTHSCSGYCQSALNSDHLFFTGTISWTGYHTIGQLYIPGGSVTNYFDGVQQNSCGSNPVCGQSAWADQGDGVPDPQSANIAISTITCAASVATVTLSAAHGFPNPSTQSVGIAGATPSGYNITSVAATITGTTTFTYPLTCPAAETVPGTATFTTSNEWSDLDNDSLVIILGTGSSTPMNVDYVRVWQLPQACQ